MSHHPDITEEQLTEWMALCDAATPGPWEGHVSRPNMGGGRSIPQVFGGPDDISVLEAWDSGNGDYDILFAAAARTAMPALIAALRDERNRYAVLEHCYGSGLKARDYEIGQLQRLLEAERAKVKRLRWALESFDCCPHCHHARCDNCDDLSARVLKETA